ncbi:sensor histidine kinase [Geobacter grbiciae]|uniref:sensor histidine kinase n=1 Tax=Geobacter grbiciae TaxID=155042 RepID=UPI001C00A318|nr:PAS domain-containing protein [Geobacter grbiciae]
MTQLSLKTRMAVGVALLFLCFGSVTGFFALTYFQQKFKESISTHQEALLSSLANDLDSKLLFAQKSLQAFAPKLTQEVLRNEDKLQQALDDKTTLHLLFDALIVFSPEGKLLTESPQKLEIRGRDYSFRDYFKKTVATGKPQISTPFVSTYAPGHPAVMLTFPLFDAKGRMTAILAGHVDLLGENFLTDLRRLSIGKSGYAVLIDENRTRLIHPDISRIMKQVPPGFNPLFDRAMAGFEGSGESVNTSGVQILASYKRLHAVNWLLGIVYPLDEAYGSLYRARAYFVSALVLGIVLMLLVSWYAMQRLISPLSRLTGHIKAMAAEPEAGGRTVPVETGDEIGTLATAFNTMMISLREKQESLRRAVTRAEDEREKADAIIAALGDGLSIQDRNFRILYQNEKHQKITGGNHVGKFCYEAYRHNNHVCDDCPVAQCFADGKVHTRENRNVSGGNAVFVEVSASPLRDATGGIVAGIELVRDITERKRTEEQVRILNAQLEQRVRERTEELQQSLKEMETFCYTVSHDLRTPLRGIHGFSSILQQDYADCLDQEGKEYLQRIGGAANRMGELIDDLLELSRVNRDELRRVPVDLTTLAGEIADDLTRSQPERNVEFVIAPGLRATGDPSLLGAVLANIIHNAWKFSSRNPAARIEVGSRTDGEEQVFYVRDNGVGFDMQYADKLFLPFHRLHAAEGFEGTGIGLATVQRIIERHGGRVWAESEPGRGATFFFTVAVS